MEIETRDIFQMHIFTWQMSLLQGHIVTEHVPAVTELLSK